MAGVLFFSMTISIKYLHFTQKIFINHNTHLTWALRFETLKNMKKKQMFEPKANF